jgi:hypothetical protein
MAKSVPVCGAITGTRPTVGARVRSNTSSISPPDPWSSQSSSTTAARCRSAPTPCTASTLRPRSPAATTAPRPRRRWTSPASPDRSKASCGDSPTTEDSPAAAIFGDGLLPPETDHGAGLEMARDRRRFSISKRRSMSPSVQTTCSRYAGRDRSLTLYGQLPHTPFDGRGMKQVGQTPRGLSSSAWRAARRRRSASCGVSAGLPPSAGISAPKCR